MIRSTIIWRIDGDMSCTEVETLLPIMSSNEALILAVTQDAEEIIFLNSTDKQNHIQFCLDQALDSDDPNFIGYELVGVIQHPEGMQHLPWVAL